MIFKKVLEAFPLKMKSESYINSRENTPRVQLECPIEMLHEIMMEMQRNLKRVDFITIFGNEMYDID